MRGVGWPIEGEGYRVAQHYKGDLAAAKVLLMAHVPVGGQKHVETGLRFAVDRNETVEPSALHSRLFETSCSGKTNGEHAHKAVCGD
jgi:hypothetical protein